MHKIGIIILCVLAYFGVNAQGQEKNRLILIGNVRVLDKVHYEVGAQYNLTSKYAFALNIIPGFYKQRNLAGKYYNSGYVRNSNSIGQANIFDPTCTVKFITIRPSFLVKMEVENYTAYNGIGVNWTRSNSTLEISYNDPLFPNKKDVFSNSIQTFSVEYTHMQVFQLSPRWSLSGTFLLGANLYENKVPNKEQSLTMSFGSYNPGQGFVIEQYLYVNLLIGIQWKLK
jgi:hypothetical protein